MKREEYEIFKPYLELTAAILSGVIFACVSAVMCKFARCVGKKTDSQKYNEFINRLDSNNKFESMQANTKAINNLANAVNTSNKIQLIQLEGLDGNREKLEKVKKMMSETSEIETSTSINTAQGDIEEGGIDTEDGTALLGS